MKNEILKQIPEFTRVSSKGQLVIPQDIRRDLHIKEGDVFATTSAHNGLIIMKRIKDPIMREDLMILKEVEEAWKEIETGRSKTMSKEDFLKEIKKW